eukprot:00667_5
MGGLSLRMVEKEKGCKIVDMKRRKKQMRVSLVHYLKARPFWSVKNCLCLRIHLKARPDRNCQVTRF